MKNKIQTLLIILTAALFFTACQKEESVENYDSISGVLTAGENMLESDIEGLTIHLGILDEGIDPMTVTSETEGLTYIASTEVNSDRSFGFNKLNNGNYVLFLDDEYLFANDIFVLLSIDGENQIAINKQVDRIIPENLHVGVTINSDPSPTQSYTFKIKNKTNYSDIQILFYESDELSYNPINFPNLSDWEFSLKLRIASKKTIQITCKTSDNNSLTTHKIEIPKVWFTKNTDYVKVNNDILRIAIKSCIGYKKITIED